MKEREKPGRRSAEPAGILIGVVLVSAWAWADLYGQDRPRPALPLELGCHSEGGTLILRSGAGGPGSLGPCTDSQRFIMGDKMDLNRAGPGDLSRLSGIGPKTAALIVSERERRGGFRSVEELQEVTGLTSRARESLALWTQVR